MDKRLTSYLIAALVVVAGLNLAMWFLMPREPSGDNWANPYEKKNEISCIKVNDLYSVHLTAYYQPLGAGDTSQSAEENEPREPGKYDKKKIKEFRRYCDRIPDVGHLFFTVDLMEKDTRKIPVAFALFRQDNGGGLELVKDQPAAPHPTGLMSLDADITDRGKYLLKVAFGEARSKDEVIEIPVIVGQ